MNLSIRYFDKDGKTITLAEVEALPVGTVYFWQVGDGARMPRTR